MGSRTRGSWVCIEDFNDISYSYEKDGRRPKYQKKMDAFNLLISDLLMFDIRFKDNPYTWCNNRNRIDRIRERLDRGIENGEWLSIYPNTVIFHKPAIR